MNSPYRVAEQLEQSLGDPASSRSVISFASAMEFDEAERFPAEFIAELRKFDAFRHLIPAELGGLLRSFEESMMMLRLIARRDLTAAIAFGQTFLGAIPVWLAGGEAQKQALALCIRNGELGCLALTEEDHGGDLLACQFAAELSGSQYLLSGTKWLINNGSGGGTVSVYARTSPQESFSAFSLFLIEKRRLSEPQLLRPLPKVRTLGIRGADISGFECQALPVPDSAIIGAPGRGYEITLKTLQISRAMCAALSLGAADTALRAALDFALRRRVFNDTVANIPSARAQLTGAYTDLLICDCLSTVASRALQSCPDRMAVWSSIAKYLVPTLVEELIAESARVLGARHYLRQGYQQGIFQKCMRDNAVVGLFDGSTAVNLHIISGQLPALANRRMSGQESPDHDERIAALFDWSRELTWSHFPRDVDLKFTNNGFDEIAGCLVRPFSEGLPDAVAPLVRQLAEALKALDAQVAALQLEKDVKPNSPARFELAKRYCLIHAAAVCLLTWLHNRGAGDSFFNDVSWLVVCLQRLLRRLTPEATPVPPAISEAVFRRMCAQFEAGHLFSLWRIQLGGVFETSL